MQWLATDLHSHLKPVENDTQEQPALLGRLPVKSLGCRLEWTEETPSASVCTHRNWNESGFHQSATAVVVIVRVGSEPKDNADKNATSSQKGELQHRQPRVEMTLVRLLGFRHPALNANVGMDRLI